MALRFGINGLGRIGRALVRVARLHPGLELVAVNDPAPPRQIFRLLRHDTVHGVYPGEVGWEPGALLLDGRRVPLSAGLAPEEIDWSVAGAEVVVEATGRCLLYTSDAADE